jgi:hypothetical protein
MAIVDFLSWPDHANVGTFTTLDSKLNIEMETSVPVTSDTIIPLEAVNSGTLSFELSEFDSFWGDDDSHGNHPYSDSGTWVVGFWFKVGNGPVATGGRRPADALFSLYDDTGVQCTVMSGGGDDNLIKLVLRKGGYDGTVVSTSPVGIINAGQSGGGLPGRDRGNWAFYEFKVVISATVGSIICEKNGVELWNEGSLDTKGDTSAIANRVLFGSMGIQFDGEQDAVKVQYHSIYIDSSTILGPVVSIGSKPTSDTAQADWTAFNGGSGYVEIDVIDKSIVFNNLNSSTVGHESTFGMADAHSDYNSSTVKSVTGWYEAGTDGGVTVGSMKMKLEVSAGTHDFGTETLVNTYDPTFMYFLDQNPVTVAAWTISEYNSIEVSLEKIT